MRTLSFGNNCVDTFNNRLHFLYNLTVWCDNFTDFLDDWLNDFMNDLWWFVLRLCSLDSSGFSGDVFLRQSNAGWSRFEVDVDWIIAWLYFNNLGNNWLVIEWNRSVFNGSSNLLDSSWNGNDLLRNTLSITNIKSVDANGIDSNCLYCWLYGNCLYCWLYGLYYTVTDWIDAYLTHAKIESIGPQSSDWSITETNDSWTYTVWWDTWESTQVNSTHRLYSNCL